MSHNHCDHQPHQHSGRSSEKLMDKPTIINALNIHPGQTVLDAGCGNGYMSKEFSRLVGDSGKVYALDPDEAAIKNLAEETHDTNITTLMADITLPTPLPAATFDLIYLSTVVHGFSPNQMEGFKKEIRRLLAPQGRLAIVEIVKRPTPFGPPMNLRFSPDELQKAVGMPSTITIDVGEHFYLQIFANQATI